MSSKFALLCLSPAIISAVELCRDEGGSVTDDELSCGKIYKEAFRSHLL
jgi:hypothetical protein